MNIFNLNKWMSKYLEEITLMTAELSVYCNSKYGPGWLGSMCRVWKQVHTNQSGESIMNSYVWAAVLRWRAAPVSTLTTAPQQYSPAQPSPAQPSPASQARPSWEWMNAGLGWLRPHCSTHHTRATELQSYRVLSPTLLCRVIQQSGSDRSSPAALHGAV